MKTTTTAAFRPLSPDGIELCGKGLHEMTEANTAWKSRGPLKNRSRQCRACARVNRRAQHERYQERKAAAQLNVEPLALRYTWERWEEDGHLYIRVATEWFEYATEETYLLKARRILQPHVRKTGFRHRPGEPWIEEVERVRDYANPRWAHSITYRTIEPVLALRAEHGRAA